MHRSVELMSSDTKLARAPKAHRCIVNTLSLKGARDIRTCENALKVLPASSNGIDQVDRESISSNLVLKMNSKASAHARRCRRDVHSCLKGFPSRLAVTSDLK